MKIRPRTIGSAKIRAEHSYVVRQVILPAQAFIHSETTGGVVLLVATIAALAWANSPWSASYFHWRETILTLDLKWLVLSQDLLHWINDGLMAVFFFVVGLEIKRELLHGELSELRKAALPILAAAGGMVVPALLYVALNAGGPGARGWGIPMATDIAFALGVLALLGKRVPSQLRVFLLALAIVDDLGAILVIAVFYSGHLSFAALGAALVFVVLIGAIAWGGARSLIGFLVLGVCLWVAVLKSGIHATIAGVVLAALIPARPWFTHQSFAPAATALLARFHQAVARRDSNEAEAALGELEELTRRTEAPLERLERLFLPWVTYLVLPVFALANAGVSLSSAVLGPAAASPVAWGIFIGLLAGKPIGILTFSWIAVRLRLAKLPAEVTWPHLLGAGVLGGIGFTVSLFITGLAFEDAQVISHAKIGIFAASILAGVGGYLLLRRGRGTRPGLG